MLYLRNSAGEAAAQAVAEAFSADYLLRERFIAHLHPYLHRASVSTRTPRMTVIGDITGGYALLGAVYGFRVRWVVDDVLSFQAQKRLDANSGDGTIELHTQRDEWTATSELIIAHIPEASSLREEWSSFLGARRAGTILCVERSSGSVLNVPDSQWTERSRIRVWGFRWRLSKRRRLGTWQRALDALAAILPFLAEKRTLMIYERV